jgi:hypothetical protein
VANGWRWTVSVIKASIPVGIKEDRELLDFHTIRTDHFPLEVYPNPATSCLAIRIPQTADRQSALGGLKIFDVSGKLIKEITFSSANEPKISLKGNKKRCLSLKDKSRK